MINGILVAAAFLAVTASLAALFAASQLAGRVDGLLAEMDRILEEPETED